MSALPVLDEEECILWTGCRDANGYGRRTKGGVAGYAHRYAWEEVHGPIPAGMTVDHLCFVKSCVNVKHMELVTRGENTRRALRKRYARGHYCNRHDQPMDRVTPKGRHYCSTCVRESNAKRRAAA